jgi:hypothetical protein
MIRTNKIHWRSLSKNFSPKEIYFFMLRFYAGSSCTLAQSTIQDLLSVLSRNLRTMRQKWTSSTQRTCSRISQPKNISKKLCLVRKTKNLWLSNKINQFCRLISNNWKRRISKCCQGRYQHLCLVPRMDLKKLTGQFCLSKTKNSSKNLKLSDLCHKF